ncbi:MAG: hypothetical protein NUV69_02295 [Candidatus Curtissbacteria bacterium]|nr:hypothetical protein [Candidatus Curtissbacteria bacterium]
MQKENDADTNSATGAIKLLWIKGFFNEERALSVVADQIKKEWNHNFSPSDLSKALTKSPFLIRKGKRLAFKYIQKISATSEKIESVKQNLFSEEVLQKLKKDFRVELKDLNLNFGNSGTCTAFLLRKILEKLVYIVFARNNIGAKIEDKNSPGGLVGLEKMLNVAAVEKIRGVPILTPKTAQKIQGIKFLGDASAHNPLVGVDMETITPQMPFIITAYKELTERL